MSELMQAHTQWATRPAEERFISLPEMHASMVARQAISRAAVVSSRRLRAVPTDDNRGLLIEGPNGHGYAPTHWAMGQAANLVGAPGAYLRELPAPLAADCLNYGFQVERDAKDIGVLLSKNGTAELRAVTGPNYGRIWDGDVVASLMDRFGDGVTGTWRVPGVRGELVDVTRDNTTLFAGDRDMFVFLADEQNRIELPGRRDGQTGTLARGFFVTNSEVGAGALRVKTFLFDFVCANRIVWGAHELDEISIRHTASAPDRFLDQVTPALLEYSRASSANVSGVLRSAQASKIDKVDKFLANRFGPRVAARVQHAHMLDEGRPIETVWDAVTGATAYARSIPFQAERVEFETKAGELLDLVEVAA
jgi:hypothetical protein